MWRPPVFKLRKDAAPISKICISALSFAVAALTLDIVQEDLIRTTNVKRSVRRGVAFLAAFVAGAIVYILLWVLFGIPS